ncbi:MAG: hypothetical protein P4L92_05815 [Rudaea sp.]|nr:hypothetical protein [Rudaea sp.]
MHARLNHKSKRAAGHRNAFGGIGAIMVLATMLNCIPAYSAVAQTPSEFLGGEGMPYAAFDRLQHTDIHVGGAIVRVGFAPGDLALSKAQVLAWIEHSAKVVSGYYGRFPVASMRLLIVPVDGTGVRGGTTWGYHGAATRLLLGNRASEDDLKQDWMIVHEMVHLALPQIDRRHNWLSEGLATYIEPIARVQAGDLTAESIWAAMVRDMPKGLPKPADQGLDRTPTWGRTYWGGAMFCLFADIGIRRQTADRHGLQDAMRGVLAAGGNHEVDWPIERVLAAADKAVGVPVMTKLYADWATKPVAPDLDALWNELGIVHDASGSASFDDRKPLAKLRASITRPAVPSR